MSDHFQRQIRELRAAIGLAQETRMDRLPAKVRDDGKSRFVFQDFSGHESSDELGVKLKGIIESIAALEPELCRWAAHNGHQPEDVLIFFKRSRPLQVIHDLWNVNKHGFPPRGGNRCGQDIRYDNVRRQMQLRTQAKKNSTAGMTLGAFGQPVIFGDGTGTAVLNADIFDRCGNHFGELSEYLIGAIDDCQELMAQLGLIACQK